VTTNKFRHISILILVYPHTTIRYCPAYAYEVSTKCYVIFIIATPADVSLLMQLGVDGVFVGSGIFKSGNPTKRAHAMAQAVTHYDKPAKIAELSEDLGTPMSGQPVTDETRIFSHK
jgi:hypothetical protein